jgi:hypothetical protein
MLEYILRTIILESIGASVKWGFNAIKSLIRKQKIKSFSYYYKGDDKDDPINRVAYGISNILLGFLVIIIFILILIIIDRINKYPI